MPPGRPVTRQRVVQNENDENTATTRLMRAKSTSNVVSEDQGKPAKGAALQPKKSAANVAGLRKRGVLGDVSNVGKADAPEGKKATGKVGLASKAAGPTGVQKSTTRTASRTALAAKETKKVETKKSGSGTIGTVQKRKVSSTSQSVKDEPVSNDEAEPVRKKVHTMEAEKENARSAAVVEPAVDEDKAARKALMEKVAIIDSADMDDPHMVPEYADDIFEYLRDIEPLSVPNPEYMNHQDDLEWKTRGILVDWLIEVHTRFHLLTETLFLTVNIIDRFLSEKVVQLDRLQLVGITAMFIASKYEEVLSPHVENFVTIADNGFSQDEILSAERAVLSTLNYDLSYPNPINFLRRISKADDYDIQCRTMGKYLMEIQLLDHRLMEFPPSQVAAGAMYLSRLMLDRGEWDDTLTYYAGYSEEEVEPVVKLMVDYLARPICHEAFFRKYAAKKFIKSSILARSWAKKNAASFGLTDVKDPVDQIS